MNHSIDDAVASKGEHDWVDFKREFDPGSAAAWCEIVRDVVAMANSGGGFIVIGLNDDGTPSGADIQATLLVDPAVVADKIRRYTGVQFASFSLHRRKRNTTDVQVVVVRAAQCPVVFTQAGTYELPDKKQGRAFSVGQVYFRHGAKSEPGVSDDLRQFVEREVSRLREEWLGNIRRVVEAPAGSVVSVAPAAPLEVVHDGAAIPARLVHAEDAAPVPWRSPDITHPYRQKEAIVEINRRIEAKAMSTALTFNSCGVISRPKTTPIWSTNQSSARFSTRLRSLIGSFVNSRTTQPSSFCCGRSRGCEQWRWRYDWLL